MIRIEEATDKELKAIQALDLMIMVMTAGIIYWLTPSEPGGA